MLIGVGFCVEFESQRFVQNLKNPEEAIKSPRFELKNKSCPDFSRQKIVLL